MTQTISISELSINDKIEVGRNKFSAIKRIQPSRRGEYVTVELNNREQHIYAGGIGTVVIEARDSD